MRTSRRRLSEEKVYSSQTEEGGASSAEAVTIKDDGYGMKAFKCTDIAAGTYELNENDLTMNEEFSFCAVSTDPDIKVEKLESLVRPLVLIFHRKMIRYILTFFFA